MKNSFPNRPDVFRSNEKTKRSQMTGRRFPVPTFFLKTSTKRSNLRTETQLSIYSIKVLKADKTDKYEKSNVLKLLKYPKSKCQVKNTLVRR